MNTIEDIVTETRDKLIKCWEEKSLPDAITKLRTELLRLDDENKDGNKYHSIGIQTGIKVEMMLEPKKALEA